MIFDNTLDEIELLWVYLAVDKYYIDSEPSSAIWIIYPFERLES
jgi:hypothetical protein